MNSEIFGKLREIFARLSQRNRIVLASVTSVVIFSLIMIFVWANRPEYSLLYSKLDAGEAAQIVDDLAGLDFGQFEHQIHYLDRRGYIGRQFAGITRILRKDGQGH